jgi:uncharacterized protein YbjT (DUF2867 family)
MKLTVFGASGGTGSSFAEQALAAGELAGVDHHVVARARARLERTGEIQLQSITCRVVQPGPRSATAC